MSRFQSSFPSFQYGGVFSVLVADPIYGVDRCGSSRISMLGAVVTMAVVGGRSPTRVASSVDFASPNAL